MIDRRTPVIVGVEQHNGATETTEPIDIIVTAARRAYANSGATPALDLIALTKIGTFSYRNAPRLVGERLGQPDVGTLQANHGGHTTQVVLAHVASEIAQGRIGTALIAGGEVGSALRSGRARSDLGTPPRSARNADLDGYPDDALGDDLFQWICHPHEAALGIAEPIQMYPLMDTALGAALGRTRDEHLHVISSLWARFSEVARHNEYAADRRGHSVRSSFGS